MENDWIKELKVGDEVIVETWNKYRYIGKVEKINKTTMRVNGLLYRMGDGSVRDGFSFSSTHLCQCTEEAKKEIMLESEKSNLVAYITRTNWQRLTNERLRKIYGIVKEDEK